MDLTIDSDHKIIVIDSSVCFFPNGDLCEFYIDLDEPLRNVYKLKIITILANIKTSSNINSDLESIYIDINNYNRLISKAIESKTIENKTIVNRFNIYYFDSLIMESKAATGENFTIKNDYNNADIEYFINPIEPQLKRFNIRLFDKNNQILKKSLDINKFIIKLGVYYNNRKTTRL